MIKFERQTFILDELNHYGTVTLADLVKKINKPRLTVQRDLRELEQAGKLTRVHGGAVARADSFTAIPKKIRGQKNISAKKKLARKAAAFITAADTVAVDPSTTCSFIADFIPDHNINVLTPSVETFLKLAQYKNINPILPGGKLNRRSQNLIGSFAAEIINKMNFSLCFLSADGFNQAAGTLEFDYEDSMIKNSMIANSARIILLIDKSKLGVRQGILTCSKDKIDTIITNAAPGKNWPADLKKITVTI
ncbi:MAG TPA: DeoR/GlpR family DNA-binding transcription regulator [Spirochaetota bacterium]|nr:DeoR/GlpR family DNA-binding transcription regulator [Spirochaetota bacterium]